MGTVVQFKRGDTGLPLIVDLSYPDHNLNITDQIGLSTAVVFIMTPVGSSTPKVNRADAAVTTVDVANKKVTVRYLWASGNVDTAGDYKGEFEFTLSGGPATAPTGGYLTIQILEDLG